MNRLELIEQIKKKKSFLCVGLDSDINKIPNEFLAKPNPILSFNKAVIDATKDYCVAYKPNIAFYEALGSKGWDILGETLEYIPKEIFTIADAKRGDIGNTANLYAKTFFETYNFDSVTVAPYMGRDSILPFLEYEDKWTIVLGLTSNEGSKDFQFNKLKDDSFLFEKVVKTICSWGNPNNLMFVVGATQMENIQRVRELAKEHFFLIPGVGAQGGDLSEVVKYAKNEDIGMLVNSSRGIIYAKTEEDFSTSVKFAAQDLQEKMAKFIL